MALLDGSILLGSQYAYEGRGPFDAKMLVSTYADLLLAETWQDKDGASLAYNGMLVAVWRDSDVDNNGVYFLHNGSKNNKGLDVTDAKNWHKLASLADLENGRIDYVTKDELDTIRAALAAKLDSGTISHSTETLPEGVTVEGTELKIVVDAYTRQEVLDKIDEKLATFTGGDSLADLKDDIAVIKETLTEKIPALESKDAAIESSIAAIQTSIENSLNIVEEHSAKIAALLEKDGELAEAIQNNTDKFNNYYTSAQIDDKISELAGNTGSIDLTLYAKIADVDTAIQTVNAAIAAKANSDEVYTKDEIEALFVTEADVITHINALISAADPENGKVISNIQHLVQYVEENASDIAGIISDVANNKIIAETNASYIAKHTDDIASINAVLAALNPPKSSAEISVADDGTLGIKEVNVNKLTQTTGDTLVLKGGSANH